MSNPLDKMPWELLPFMGLPTVSYPSLSSSPVQIAAADPTRVLLIIGSQQSSEFQFSPDPNVGVGMTHPGFWVGDAMPPTILTYWLYGPIVCAAWYGTTSFSGPIAVVTQSLAFPVSEVSNYMQLVQSMQKPKPSGPSITGRLAALWAKLTGRNLGG